MARWPKDTAYLLPPLLSGCRFQNPPAIAAEEPETLAGRDNPSRTRVAFRNRCILLLGSKDCRG